MQDYGARNDSELPYPESKPIDVTLSEMGNERDNDGKWIRPILTLGPRGPEAAASPWPARLPRMIASQALEYWCRWDLVNA
jgi:hypothetical protein